jgi:hypothetical protein
LLTEKESKTWMPGTRSGMTNPIGEVYFPFAILLQCSHAA